MAVRELGVARESASAAWSAAVQAQNEAERAMQALGQQALERALADGQPAILLAGRSYNAFTSDASQSVGKKLSSMGMLAIPTDCLMPVGEGPTAWHFANQIVNAMTLAKRHPNLFLIFVSNFSCTIDAFTLSMLSSEMGPKPYLILEIDSHTADAGVQTRLEAFLDIVHNYRRKAKPASRRPFRPCRLTSDGPGREFQWRADSAWRSSRQAVFAQLFPIPREGAGTGHSLAGSSRRRRVVTGPDANSNEVCNSLPGASACRCPFVLDSCCTSTNIDSPAKFLVCTCFKVVHLA